MRAGEDVRIHSAELKQELGLWDLVFTQILFIMGMSWVGAGAKLGPSHAVFWLLAVILFYIPSAIVVIHLSRKMPLEGGLYQWAKIGFDERVGFLVAWNLWIYSMILNSEIGLISATSIAYAFGDRAQWIVESKWFIGLASAIIMAGLSWLSTVGLGAGKWLHRAGGFTMVAILSLMIVLPGVDWLRGGHPKTQPFSLAMPALTLLNLNILGKLGFGALGGFEYIAIFAGETREAAKLIGRSVIIAAPVIAVLFILGTGSVLWYDGDQNIDLISPISQVLAIATHPFGVGARIASVVILCVLGMRVAQVSVNFSGTARLPMVAGWDDLLPQWFTRLHPKYRTPMLSILFVGAMTLAFSISGMLGVGSQEAMQLFNNAAGIYYALTYLVMFAVPIASRDASALVKIASLSGFAMTLLYVVLSIFPIIAVESRFWFSMKIGGVVVLGNVLGFAILWIAERKKRSRGGRASAGAEL
ncbi:MAG: APC family permease [Acidobacteriia bacterium]|nr:APC family permease [Terriglobia bacterium]